MSDLQKISLHSNNGMRAEFTNYGARLMSLFVPNLKNELVNVCLGFQEPEAYLSADEKYFGAIVGRYCNRIANASFELEGKTYQLAKNSDNHHLHGGLKAFHTVLWNIELITENAVKFSYYSPDGEEGYPGNVEVSIIYTLTDDELKIDIEAVSDRTTVLNVTAHPYFNLRGEGNGDILSHLLKIHADAYIPVDREVIPTGGINTVENTPFDFRDFHKIGDRIDEDFEQLIRGSGYDHNYVLNIDYPGFYFHAASVIEPVSRLKMDLFTTEPGLQFYSANWLSGADTGYQGKAYEKRSAFCLEPQHFPDSPNNQHFPSTVLHKGEIYRSKTAFKFSTESNV